MNNALSTLYDDNNFCSEIDFRRSGAYSEKTNFEPYIIQVGGLPFNKI